MNAATRLALRWLCPPLGYRAFLGLHAYFRWADDVVDAPDRHGPSVLDFLVAQRALLAGGRPAAGPAEAGLIEALAGSALGGRLRPAVVRMLDALAFDAARGPEPLSPAALEAQVRRVGDSYLDALWGCAGAQGEVPERLYELPRAATLTHVLRDIEIDLALGYCNLPPAAVAPAGRARAGGDQAGAGYELTPGAASWVLAQCVVAEARFEAGARALPGVRPWRARWLLALYAWQYRRLLRRIRRRWIAPRR